jgi:hypothetical protein
VSKSKLRVKINVDCVRHRLDGRRRTEEEEEEERTNP